MAFHTEYRPSPKSASLLAIAALVSGIVQFATGITFIPAIILGHIARRQIRKTGERRVALAAVVAPGDWAR